MVVWGFGFWGWGLILSFWGWGFLLMGFGPVVWSLFEVFWVWGSLYKHKRITLGKKWRLHITYQYYYFLFDYSYLHFSSKSTKKGSITAFAKTIDDRTTQWSMRINDPELSDDPFSRNRRWMSCYCTGDDMMDREVTIGTAMLIDYGCKHK